MQLLCFSIGLLPKKEKTTLPQKHGLLCPRLKGLRTDFLKRVVDWWGVSGRPVTRSTQDSYILTFLYNYLVYISLR
jgi:hypothetical protein